MKNRCNALSVAPDITLYHTGPALDHGPLPALFYFAISGPDSLCLDPFNQPVQFLQGEMVRIFSMTLPGHENDLPAKDAMKIWADDMQNGQNRIAEFLDQVQEAVDFAIKEQFADSSKMSTAGLSRGAMIAAHLAARDSRFRNLACFAPLTQLRYIREFREIQHNPIANSLDLFHLADALGDRHIKLFIGNEDTRVGTKECFDFAMELVARKKTRTAQVDLQIYPSVGQMGHGTPPEIFKQGVSWILSHLKT
ncbi:MAG: prolyl oligopeptidase family serine peptidase [Parachlamydiales bacterium]|nr:prolyl oligopeptidase family serine peptidase [Parachlamydiales bacterium]